MQAGYLCLAAILWTSAIIGLSARVHAEDLYLGFDQNALFSRLGLQVERTGLDAYYPASQKYPKVVYHLRRPGDRVVVAVYPSVAEARRAFQYDALMVPAPPIAPPAGEAIGDEMRWGYAQEAPDTGGGTVTFRRGNIFFGLRTAQGPASQVVELARTVDRLIRDDRQIAPRGTFAETPEIVDLGFPQTLTVRPMRRVDRQGEPLPWLRPEKACIRIHPRFRGLGPVERLRFWLVIEGAGRNQTDSPPTELPADWWVSVPDEAGRIRDVPRSAENDGRFILELRVPEERITTRARAIAASADNLIVTKEVEVTIVPQR